MFFAPYANIDNTAQDEDSLDSFHRRAIWNYGEGVVELMKWNKSWDDEGSVACFLRLAIEDAVDKHGNRRPVFETVVASLAARLLEVASFNGESATLSFSKMTRVMRTAVKYGRYYCLLQLHETKLISSFFEYANLQFHDPEPRADHPAGARPRLGLLHRTDLRPGPEKLCHLKRWLLSVAVTNIRNWEERCCTADQRYQTIQFLIETLGTNVSFSWPIQLPDGGSKNNSSTIILSLLEETTNSRTPIHPEVLKTGLYEFARRVLELLLKHGAIMAPGELFHEDNWFMHMGSMLLFGKFGYYLGPFISGRSRSLLHMYGNSDWNRRFQAIELVLEQGCDVDIRDNRGDTPLMAILANFVVHFLPLAGSSWKSLEYWKGPEDARNFLRRSIRFFLRSGADPFALNQNAGWSPITVAMVLGETFPTLVEDMVTLDARRNERYGSLTPKEVHEKWENDDPLWNKLLPNGASSRVELEPQVYKLPLCLDSNDAVAGGLGWDYWGQPMRFGHLYGWF